MPIAIAGLFSTASGIGEGARLAYAALEDAGLAPSAFDLSAAFGQSEFSSAARRPLTPGAGTLIVHHNAPYMAHALWALGRERIKGRRIVGYWAWELPKLPPLWRGGFRFAHEIWVPSTFTRDAVAAATDMPVRVVPHPLPPMPVTPNMRGKLGLPQDALIVLTAFHLGSAFARKNPLAAVAAFRKAFGDDTGRVLAVKLIDNGASAARCELDAAIAGAANIRLIEGTLPAADMAGLMAAADIVISLHRSEGFGLVPAQAMALGKPVVATGWSGNVDFMTDENSALIDYTLVPVRDAEGAFGGAGQHWAEPSVEHAAEWLRKLAASAELRTAMGARAAADVKAQFAPDKFARTVTELIEPAANRAVTAARKQADAATPRIVINGRFLTQKVLGVQRFAIETIQAIDKLLDTEAYRALRGRIEIVAPKAARDFPLKNIPLRRAGFSSGYFWEQVELPFLARGRLQLNLCMLGPLVSRNQVVVVHDATVRALPQNFSWKFRTAYGFIIPRLCRRAISVVTVSQFSRAEIGRYYGADTAAMTICYEGGDHIANVPADTSALERFGLAGKRYFLAVGVGSSNKNIETVRRGVPEGSSRRHHAGPHRQARRRCARRRRRGAVAQRPQCRPRQRRRIAHALRARAGAGFPVALRGLRPAGGRGDDTRLPGDRQRPAGAHRGLRRCGAYLRRRRRRGACRAPALARRQRGAARAARRRRARAGPPFHLGSDRAHLARSVSCGGRRVTCSAA